MIFLKRKKYTPYLFIVPALLFILIFVYVPIVQNFYYSFFRMNSYSPTKTFIGISNYLDIFQNEIFYTALINNTWYAVISLIFQVGLGLILAITLESKILGRERKFFRTIYFLPSVIAIAAVGLMFYYIYNPNLGLLNAVIRIFTENDFRYAWLGHPRTAIFAIIAMSQWQFTGYIMILLIVAIQKIPEELYEVAEIDGASSFQKALYVTIPQIKEMILVTSIITVIGSYKLFTEIFVITRGGPYDSTHVLGTFMYKTAFFYDKMGYAAAIAGIIFVITFTTSVIQIFISKRGEN